MVLFAIFISPHGLLAVFYSYFASRQRPSIQRSELFPDGEIRSEKGYPPDVCGYFSPDCLEDCFGRKRGRRGKAVPLAKSRATNRGGPVWPRGLSCRRGRRPRRDQFPLRSVGFLSPNGASGTVREMLLRRGKTFPRVRLRKTGPFWKNGRSFQGPRQKTVFGKGQIFRGPGKQGASGKGH